MNPAGDRVAAASEGAAAGTTVPPLRRLQGVVADDKALGEYLDWASSPFARTVVGALRDLALWGPVGTASCDVPVQYGVSVGLSLAARLIEDPSAVIASPRKDQPAPRMEFSTRVEDALDTL